jgi:hypothetical protein
MPSPAILFMDLYFNLSQIVNIPVGEGGGGDFIPISWGILPLPPPLPPPSGQDTSLPENVK